MKPLSMSEFWNGPFPAIMQQVAQGVTVGALDSQQTDLPRIEWAYHKANDALIVVQVAKDGSAIARDELVAFGALCVLSGIGCEQAPEALRTIDGQTLDITGAQPRFDRPEEPQGGGFMGFRPRR